LVGLAAGFTLLVCYIIQVTTSSVTGVNLEFSDGQVK